MLFSSLPVTYKFDSVYFVLHRFFSICSSYEKFYDEIVLLKNIFRKNEYPHFLIDIRISNYLRQLLVPKRVIHTADKKKVLLVLLFLGPLSLRLGPVYKTALKVTFVIVH